MKLALINDENETCFDFFFFSFIPFGNDASRLVSSTMDTSANSANSVDAPADDSISEVVLNLDHLRNIGELTELNFLIEVLFHSYGERQL